MIHFFRKLRLNFLSKNSISRYFLYAMGEITLVVIGILIALQINNRNEDRKQKAEIARVYISIIDELESDDQTLTRILPDFTWKSKVINRIVKEPISVSEWIENDSLFNSFFSFEDFAIGKERFQLLKAKTAVDEESRTLNNRITDFYNKHSVDIGVRTHEANMSYHRNIKYWEEIEDWFSLAIVKRDYSKLGEYANNSSIFKNKLTWYRIMLIRLTSALEAYQKEGRALVAEIKAYLEKAGHPQ